VVVKFAIWIEPGFVCHRDSPNKAKTLKGRKGSVNSVERNVRKTIFDPVVDFLGRWMIVCFHYFAKDLQPLWSSLDPLVLADLSESIKFLLWQKMCVLVLHV